MPTFGYIVKDKVGRTHTGSLETASRNTLIEQLWKQDFVVLAIEEKSPAKSSIIKVGQPKVRPQQLVIFSRQLATLVDSGIPISPSIEILADQMEDRNFRQTLTKLRDDIEAGSSLSEAIGRHPRTFSEFFINMVRAGESSGRLDEILDRVATYIEKISILQGKVRASLVYPAFVTVLSFGITTFLIVVIVPKFESIFKALGGELPTATRLLLNLSHFMGNYLVYEAVGLIAFIVLLRVFSGTKTGRLWLDQFTLKLPVFGKLLQKVFIARFSRTLSTLVRSGVPILGSLDIVFGEIDR